MSKSSNGSFVLRLSGTKSITLCSGAVLKASDLPGLQSAPPGGPVATVNRHPIDPNVQGLKNLSPSSWRVRLPNGETKEVKTGKSVRLATGTRVNFGSITGDIQLVPQITKTSTWAWALAGAAALCLITASGWSLYHFRLKPVTTTAKANPPEQPAIQQRAIEPAPVAQGKSSQPAPVIPDSQESSSPAQAMPKAAPSVVAKSSPPTTEPSGPQDFIDFDCLDGAYFDPKARRLSLFGHRANPDRVQLIPYFDYLATALECKEPGFSLEWMPESYPQVDRIQKTGGKAIIDWLTEEWDKDSKLTSAAAWLLQQYGVPVAQGMSESMTDACILRAAGNETTAEVLESLSVWYHSEGDAHERAEMALYHVLGVDSDYQDVLAKAKDKASFEQLMDEFDSKFFTALSNRLESKKNYYAEMYQEARRKGLSRADAFKYAQRDVHKGFERLANAALDKIATPDIEIALPPSMIEAAIGGGGARVYPVFEGLPPRSLLASTALEADVALKSLMYAKQLKQRIPGYRTEFEFRNATGHPIPEGRGEYMRWWIAPAKFELTQSADGNLVRFTSSKMVISARQQSVNLRKVTLDRQRIDPNHALTDVVDPALNQYAAELTQEYDALAREVPILHDVHEAMKVVALARWMQKRNFRIELPREAHQEWSPPKELQGAIHVSIARKLGHGYNVTQEMVANGGVDLDVDPKVKTDPNLSVPPDESLKIRSPIGGEATAFQKNQPFDPNLSGPAEQLKASSDLRDIAAPHFQATNPNPPAAAPATEKTAWNDGVKAYQGLHFKEAVQDFTKALEYDPGNPHLLGNLGLSRAALKKHPLIGGAAAVRGEVFLATEDGRHIPVTSGMAIPLNYRVLTNDSGHLQILLLDETVFTLGPNSDMVIDEFVYDPNTTAGKLAAALVKGIFRWVTGKMAKQREPNQHVRLPTGCLGIRGTEFEVSVSESGLGEISLFSGELEITPHTGGLLPHPAKRNASTFVLKSGNYVSFTASAKFSQPRPLGERRH